MNTSRLILAAVIFAVITGLVIFYVNKKTEPINPNNGTVSSFSKCVAAGNAVMEGNPRQCRTDDGNLFIEDTVGGTWKTSSDSESGISFEYPERLSTQYIQTVNWPPIIQIGQGALTCSEGGQPQDRMGKTEQRTINGRNYCVTEISEGTAGSVYTQYAYAFAAGEQLATLTFSLRLPQCTNYDLSARAECEAERESFDLNRLVDDIAQTVIINN